MISLSLSDTAFTWFISLAPNSIFTWPQLEQKFYEYFILGILSLGCHILLSLNKSIVSMSPIALGGLGML
jgi:hypothetical protein